MPRARVGQIELEYEVVGHPNGRPLLLIGGVGAQLVSWDDAFCELLAWRGYSVIRYDNRDSGLSTILDGMGVPDVLGLVLGGGSAPYSLEDMAADALGLLDQVGIEKAHVLGVSMGGMIGQLLALHHPERVETLVAALSGPPGRPTGTPQPSVVEAMLRPPRQTFAERVAAAVQLRHALAGGAETFDEVDARRRAELQIARAYHPAGTLRQAAAVLAMPNRLHDLAGMQVRTMLVHAELDPLVPFDSARSAAQAIPNATFIPLPGLGHDLPPAVSEELIEHVAEFHSNSPRVTVFDSPAFRW